MPGRQHEKQAPDLCDLRINVTRNDETQKELVNELQVRPRGFQARFILLRVVMRVEVPGTERKGSEQIRADLPRRTQR